jgi:malonate transporter
MAKPARLFYQGGLMSWQSWLFALNVTVPGLLMLFIGIVLKRFGWIDEHFNNTASKLVFYLALPCLIFFSMANNNSDITAHYTLALYGAVSTVISYLLLEFSAPWLIKDRRERGIFVQGGFRSNAAIMGMTYSAIAYGREGVMLGSIYLISTVVLFNILSIVTLTRSLSGDGQKVALKKLLKDILSNPLIMAIAVGLIFSYFSLSLPEPIARTGQFLSGLTLPLAMICAGASINLRMMFTASNTAVYATFARSFLVPCLVTGGAYLCGFSGIELGVIFLLTTTPSAAVSFVMVKAMGGNASLAANIIVMTTVASFFSAVLGLSLLRSSGLI